MLAVRAPRRSRRRRPARSRGVHQARQSSARAACCHCARCHSRGSASCRNLGDAARSPGSRPPRAADDLHEAVHVVRPAVRRTTTRPPAARRPCSRHQEPAAICFGGPRAGSLAPRAVGRAVRQMPARLRAEVRSGGGAWQSATLRLSPGNAAGQGPGGQACLSSSVCVQTAVKPNVNAKRCHAGVEERDLERPIDDGPGLPDHW